MNNSGNTPNYSNWIPKRLMILLWSLTGVSVLLVAAGFFIWEVTALRVIFSIVAIGLFGYTAYMQACFHTFSFTGGGLMKNIHGFVLDHLKWNGRGRLLDIGCGSGALTIRCAQKYPGAKVTGVDYWGIEWDYAKEQCQHNAKLEHVENTEFVKGDAADLPFGTGTFDAAVSNFVFHEVRTSKNKRDVVREALRVLKKGGTFAFHDIFERKSMYGDMNEFISELKASGISEIHYIPNTEKQIEKAPKMLANLGLIYGRK